MPAASRLHQFADSIAGQLERGKYWYLTYISIAYIATTLLRAQAKLVWHDELFTYHISRLPSFEAIWQALLNRADMNPPLLYFATKISFELFGEGHISVRLPSILGYLIFSICIFRFVLRRCPAVYAFGAVGFLFVCGAYDFAIEARSYGVVLAFAGLALICWQSVASGDRHRKRWLAGLAFSLAAAMFTHAYAVLLIPAFALGELTRSWASRRIDWPIWLTFSAGVPSIIIYLHLLSNWSKAQLASVAYSPTYSSLPEFYHFLFEPALWPLFLVAVLTGIALCSDHPVPLHGVLVPRHELAAAIGFALIPLPAFLISLTVTKVFFNRYGLASTAGLAILLVFLAARAARGWAFPGVAMAIVFPTAFLIQFGVFLNGLSPASASTAVVAQPDSPEKAEPSLPLVLSEPGAFMKWDRYSAPEVAARSYYLWDRSAAIRFTGSELIDVGLSSMKSWYPFRSRVVPYREFLSEHKRFLLLAHWQHPLDWLVNQLLEDGASLRLRGRYGEYYLYEVQR